MRQMCMCENAACPLHQGRDCDNPADAKIKWHGYPTAMCKHCLDVAVKSDPTNIQIVKPITAAAQPKLFEEPPVYRVIKNYDVWGHGEQHRGEYPGFLAVKPGGGIMSGTYNTPEEARTAILKQFPGAAVEIDLPRHYRASLFRKNGQGTGNETFDHVWDEFHAEMKDPKNEGRSFHEMLEEHPLKHQLLVALGKLNYMMENGGFEKWIEEGYAFDTGDLLLAKLPKHDHAYPTLSKLHDILEEALGSYAEFGVDSYKDLERLLTGHHRQGGLRWAGPGRDTLWGWFKKEFKDRFRFRGGVAEPHDLEEISGHWGEIKLEDEPISQDLLDRYTSEAAEVEEELAKLPELGRASKRQAAEREELMKYQADLDAAIEAIGYRLELLAEWKKYVSGGWAEKAELELDALTTDYYEVVTKPSLVGESAELFNATPDDVGAVVHEGEFEAEETEEEALPEAA